MVDPQGQTSVDETVERFHATSGKIPGVIAIGVAAVVIVFSVVERDRGFPLPIVLGAVAFGILAWAALIRPRVWATREHLVMRNMLHTAWVPLAAIEQVAVRQVLAVSAGDRRFVSPAIGRTLRQTVKNNRAVKPERAIESYPVFVEERILQLADDARTQHGVRRFSEEQAALAVGARKAWAWPEIAGLVVFLGGAVVTMLVR
ncbi:hypothetical protein ACT8ZV_07135 [Nocardioides sp. MAHUQ-72]|uniref:hypothetical protein n=1 Tax=unclassified Nocardioides TaxID=2615069 RepID=UPI0036207B3B